MNIKHLIGFGILIVIIVFLAVTQWSGTTTVHAPSPAPSQETEETETLTRNTYSLTYPSDATAQEREGETVISYIGPTQSASGRTQTELFDGYALRIGATAPTTSTSLRQITESERKNAVMHCQEQQGNVSEVTSRSIDGEAGFQYTAQGCYIDYTETFVIFRGNIYRISQSYVGNAEDHQRYKNLTDDMVSSIRFIR